MAISVTLNRISARELEQLHEVAQQAGAHIETNILSRSLSFLKDADYDSLWPTTADVPLISNFVRDTLKRPTYEVDYIAKYYNHTPLDEPPCVLGYTQVFVMSNGDVLTGCYPLKPVGNILRDSLETILASDAYISQARSHGPPRMPRLHLRRRDVPSRAKSYLQRLLRTQPPETPESRRGELFRLIAATWLAGIVRPHEFRQNSARTNRNCGWASGNSAGQFKRGRRERHSIPTA